MQRKSDISISRTHSTTYTGIRITYTNGILENIILEYIFTKLARAKFSANWWKTMIFGHMTVRNPGQHY